MTEREQLEKMRSDWDARARQNPKYWVATGTDEVRGRKVRENTGATNWSDQDFYASGERTVADDILTDMGNICQGKNPRDMRVLEIGCGAGRITRALAKLFGEVHAVDVSGEMVRLAREGLHEFPNAFVYHNNGMDLTVIPVQEFDFAYSTIVFQHIPSREIIENYVREVHRLLRTGALFKFQVQGDVSFETKPDDTWLGVGFSDQQAVEMAWRTGFDPRYRYGAGEQYFWLWFFKKP